MNSHNLFLEVESVKKKLSSKKGTMTTDILCK